MENNCFTPIVPQCPAPAPVTFHTVEITDINPRLNPPSANGEWRNIIAKYSQTNDIYIYNSDGIPTLVGNQNPLEISADLEKKIDNETNLREAADTNLNTSLTAYIDEQIANVEAGIVSFTDEQKAALDSGITAEKVATYDGYASDIAKKANSDDTYTKEEVYTKTEVDEKIPTVPTVGDGSVTIKQGDNTLGVFTVNQETNSEITIPASSAITSDIQTVLETGNTATDKTLVMQDAEDVSSQSILSDNSLVLYELDDSTSQSASLNAEKVEFTNTGDIGDKLVSYGLSGVSGTDENSNAFTAPMWRLIYEKTATGETSESAAFEVGHHYKEYRIEFQGRAFDSTVTPLLTVDNISTMNLLLAYKTTTSSDGAATALTTEYENTDNLLLGTELNTGGYIKATIHINTDLNYTNSNTTVHDGLATVDILVLGTTVDLSKHVVAIVVGGDKTSSTAQSLSDPSSFELTLSDAIMGYTLKVYARD